MQPSLNLKTEVEPDTGMRRTSIFLWVAVGLQPQQQLSFSTTALNS